MTGLRPYLSATIPHNAEVMKRPSIMADPINNNHKVDSRLIQMIQLYWLTLSNW